MSNPDIKSLKNEVIKINNAGGTAFPITYKYDNYSISVTSHGMTLRDYFAAKAMQGLLANSETNRTWGVNENAKYAYQQADAMLKAGDED